MSMGGYVYILTTKYNTVLYIGVTANLSLRDYQHKIKFNKNSFTKKYNIDKLVYVERYESIQEAIAREKQLKGWRRDKKINLIKNLNPDFEELSSIGSLV